jgi:hypothetical protein
MAVWLPLQLLGLGADVGVSHSLSTRLFAAYSDMSSHIVGTGDSNQPAFEVTEYYLYL